MQFTLNQYGDLYKIAANEDENKTKFVLLWNQI